MKSNFLIATLLVIVIQIVVATLSYLNLYVQNELHRAAYDLSFGAVLVLLCAYPVFLYFLSQRSRLTELNLVLEDAMKRANEADIAKSEFLANMSHEIRTPMNGVMGMAELLAKTELNDKQKMFTDVIVKSGASLLTIINDVLDFSKIESGKLMLDPAPFKLVEVVDGVSALLSSKFAEKNVELVVRISPDLPETVVGDQGRIRQLLINMLGNASKFTEVGHVLLDVSASSTEVDAPAALAEYDQIIMLKVSIEDTGIGISKENCETIFNKFSQADTSATRRHEGTGLGLSISSSLVKMMGGTIGVHSELGKGSKFWFEIPLPVDGNSVKRLENTADIAGARILIVDDNAVNRSILCEQMQTWNFNTKGACSGEEAIAMITQAAGGDEEFNLMILDYQMPGMTGGDVIKALNASDNLSNFPVVMLASVDETEDGQSFTSLGVAAHLTKPARTAELFESISRALRETWHSNPNSAVNTSAPLYEAEILALPETLDVEEIDILVAEDNAVNQIVFTQILEATNWRFKIAENGKQAVEYNTLYRPKIILMDVSMPVMNGHEATRAIRNQEQESIEHVPIIAVTAHAIAGDKQNCLDAGMDDYLAKPVSPAILEDKIDYWMEEILEQNFSNEQETLLRA